MRWLLLLKKDIIRLFVYLLKLKKLRKRSPVIEVKSKELLIQGPGQCLLSLHIRHALFTISLHWIGKNCLNALRLALWTVNLANPDNTYSPCLKTQHYSPGPYKISHSNSTLCNKPTPAYTVHPPPYYVYRPHTQLAYVQAQNNP